MIRKVHVDYESPRDKDNPPAIEILNIAVNDLTDLRFKDRVIQIWGGHIDFTTMRSGERMLTVLPYERIILMEVTPWVE